MPEISASEYLNSLLAAYQTAEKHYSQAVTDLVAAEIRRDEAKTAKEEALIRLENARAKYGGTSSRKNPSPKKRNSLRGAQNKSPIFLKRGSFSFGKKGTGSQKLESVPLEPPIPGSKKPPKIFSKSQLKRLSTSKIAPGPFEPLESVRGVYDVFSRKLPLPLVLPPTTNGTREELVLPTEDITVVSEPNRTQAEPIHAMNRNARRPKKANKGARPCSRASRRRKKEALGRRSRK